MTKMGQKRTEKRQPTKIRLTPEYRKELALRSRLKKELIAEMEFPHCMVCKTTGDIRGLSLAHIVPLSRGGKTERGNVEILCYDCHLRFEKKPGLRNNNQ